MPEPNHSSQPATPGIFSPKQERSARTQAAILDAAREIMLKGGVAALTISSVAARVGLTTGAFYARFRNKDALLQALFEETFEINRRAIDELISRVRSTQADLAEIITIFVPPAVELIRNNSALFRLFGSDHGNSGSDQDRAVMLLEGTIAPMRELLQEHEEEIPDRDPDVCAAMLVVMVQGTVDWSMLMRQSRNPVVPIRDDTLAAEITRAMLGYLGLNATQALQENST